MQAPTTYQLPARLNTLAAMAGLLERLDKQRTSATAQQYREVAHRVSQLLGGVDGDEHLHALLRAAPATAELYENLHYAHAGLVRAPLEAALNAELAATAAINRARTGDPASRRGTGSAGPQADGQR